MSETKPEDWLCGGDTGVSSVAIYVVMQGVRPLGDRRFYGDIPHDPADFGRCYRLIKLFPEWRGRLSEMAARFPKWGPMVAEWSRLEKMYEAILDAEAKHGQVSCPYRARKSEVAAYEAHPVTKARRALYEFMSGDLYDACMVADGWTPTGPGSWEKKS